MDTFVQHLEDQESSLRPLSRSTRWRGVKLKHEIEIGTKKGHPDCLIAATPGSAKFAAAVKHNAGATPAFPILPASICSQLEKYTLHSQYT
jgi:hypothetical protein